MSDIYDRLNCRTFAIGHYFDNGDVLFVDDEGLLAIDDDTTFFQFKGSQVFAGNGIIIGPETETEDGKYTIHDCRTEDIEVEFTDVNTAVIPEAGFKLYGFGE